MENMAATPLGNAFSTAENQVSQCDDQSSRSIAETPVIRSGQKKFEQLLPRGSKTPLHTRKEVGVARASLANSSEPVSVKTDKALCEPITVLWRNKKAGP